MVDDLALGVQEKEEEAEEWQESLEGGESSAKLAIEEKLKKELIRDLMRVPHGVKRNTVEMVCPSALFSNRFSQYCSILCLFLRVPVVSQEVRVQVRDERVEQQLEKMDMDDMFEMLFETK